MHDKKINEFTHYQSFNTKLEEIHKQPVIIPKPKEFIELLNTDLSHNAGFDYAKSIFIFGCLTGLRFGDIMNLKKKNLGDENGLRYLIADISKTKEKQIRIPLHEIAYNIFVKNDYNFEITNQALNRNLHDMFEYLKFDRIVTRYEKRKKDSEDIDLPFFKLITMHSSRRFFISTLVNSKKVSLGNIMKWTRHSTDVILSYIEDGYEEEELMRDVFSGFQS
jgi:integrase